MSLVSLPIYYVLFAPLRLEKQVELELKGIKYSRHDRLFFVHDSINKDWIWPQQVWYKPTVLKVNSIKDAAKKLRDASRGAAWKSYSIVHHRRTALIEENLRLAQVNRVSYLQKDFLKTAEWLLLDENTILYSTDNLSSVPLGQLEFQEDKKLPPSRAYLKLWEVFTFHLAPPSAGAIVMDLGACPGGWTWVLKNHAKQVISVDKAPLDKSILSDPKVSYLSKDAFKLQHQDVQNVDWLLSDIACYPEKLLDLVRYWMLEPKIKTFICTIKLQDNFDTTAVNELQKIPKSRLVHLYQNKNELTWILQR